MKITTASKSGVGSALATCPKGYVVIGGGYFSSDPNVINNQKQDEDSWLVQAAPGGKHRAGSVTAKAVCAKGANGIKVVDSGNE